MFLESTPTRMPPKSDGICARLIYDFHSTQLQGGTASRIQPFLSLMGYNSHFELRAFRPPLKFEGNVTKFAPHGALALNVRRQVDFDERAPTPTMWSGQG